MAKEEWGRPEVCASDTAVYVSPYSIGPCADEAPHNGGSNLVQYCYIKK